MKLVAFLVFMFFTFAETPAVPIDTPDTDERNNFVIRCPDGWGYHTFKGENGLIGVFWPKGTSFNLTDTAIFVFLQDKSKPLPKIADNINLFTEKCTKARFKFLPSEAENNPTKSLGERYFHGRCGRTMVIIEESVENYNIVILIASAKAYITKKQLSDLKEIANAYKREAEEYVKKPILKMKTRKKQTLQKKRLKTHLKIRVLAKVEISLFEPLIIRIYKVIKITFARGLLAEIVFFRAITFSLPCFVLVQEFTNNRDAQNKFVFHQI